jgi:hypothetical protein
MGAGKTLALCWKAYLAITKYNPGCRGLITFPVYDDIQETFLPTWRFLWPAEDVHWFYHETKKKITFSFDGRAEIVLRARQKAERFRGPQYAWGIDDEAAVDPDLEALTLIDTRIRARCPHPFHDSTSTPKLGMYSDYIQRGKEGRTRVIQGSSYENPYQSRSYIEDQAENMDPDKFRQEIMVSGMAWKNFKVER